MHLSGVTLSMTAGVSVGGVAAAAAGVTNSVASKMARTNPQLCTDLKDITHHQYRQFFVLRSDHRAVEVLMTEQVHTQIGIQ